MPSDWDVVKTTDDPKPPATASGGWDVVKHEDAPGALSAIGKWAGGYYKGLGGGLKDTATGLVSAAAHPIETGKALGEAASHPFRTAGAVGQAIVSTGEQMFSDDPEKSGEATGRAAFNIGSALVGGGGALNTARKVGTLARDAASAAKAGNLTKAGIATARTERETAQAAKLLPPTYKQSAEAAKSAGLPAADTIATAERDTVAATTQREAEQAYKLLDTRRSNVADMEWSRYRDTAATLEKNGEYFEDSIGGQALLADLWSIEKGGTDALVTTYGPEMQKIASQLNEVLAGKPGLLGQRRPVSLQVVDEELRKMRKIQFDKSLTGYEAVQAARIGKFADKLSDALKSWVGEDNYPRASYAQLSEDLHKFNTKLGQQLTGRQKIEYVAREDSPLKKGGAWDDAAFKDLQSLNEFRGMVGTQTADKLALRYISNELAGKTSDKALVWLKNNRWVSEVPGAQGMVIKHGLMMGTLEKNAADRARWLKLAKQAGGGAVAGAGLYEGYKYVAPRGPYSVQP